MIRKGEKGKTHDNVLGIILKAYALNTVHRYVVVSNVMIGSEWRTRIDNGLRTGSSSFFAMI